MTDQCYTDLSLKHSFTGSGCSCRGLAFGQRGDEESQPHLEGCMQRGDHLLYLLLPLVPDVHVLDVVT